ncbi:hypothetical protein ACS0TY_024546 [Phlomoides rotata]
MAGDFNSIKRTCEQVGCRAKSCNRDIKAFDSFVQDSSLIDLPLHGKSFTWYRPDGSCQSRIDRILVIKDWGAKPFWCSNAWFSHPGFKDFIMEKLSSYEVSGWGGYKLKEKFKNLKADLKTWNIESFGSLEDNIEKMKDKIKKLDLIDDVLGLDDWETNKRNEE